MKSLLSLLARYALTLSAVAAATLLAFMMWKHYAQTPWTRDGRVRADVVQIAPDVSGPVISVAVRDNQWVMCSTPSIRAGSGWRWPARRRMWNRNAMRC